MRHGTGHKGRNIGLALGGGGARGLAHIGVLKVLDREKIPLRIIAGTSIGALVGAGFASGIHPQDLEKKVEEYLNSPRFQVSAVKAIEEAHAKGELSLGRRIQSFLRNRNFRLFELALSRRPLRLSLLREIPMASAISMPFQKAERLMGS